MTYDPHASVAQLSSALPIALLPVRLETRFVLGTNPVLRIRIYPDELAAELHDPRLTADEVAAGHAYWTAGWDPADEAAQWAILEERHAARAAWIVHATQPHNAGDPTRPAGAPSFPTPPLREPSLPTAVTRVLPDAWVAIAYRGGAEVSRVVGDPIAVPLHLSFRGELADGGPGMFEHDGLVLEPELAWAVDFAHAVTAGMALTLPLTNDDVAFGFDRLIVVGVKAALAPAASAERLAELLDAHHHARGLALVRQGTPTNNTAAGPSGYPAPDDPARRFAIERGPALAAPGSDGARLATALGVPADVFAHVEGADRTEGANAAAMAEALWPCTLGYFLEQLMAPAVSAQAIEEVRVHARDFVRGRGPLPVFRAGRVPYGVLPVTALARWQSDPGAPDFEKHLRDLLLVWRARYLERAGGVPRVGASADPDADLLGVLARTAASGEVRLREVRGPAFTHNLLDLLGIGTSLEEAARAALMMAILAAAGLDGTAPRLTGLTFADEARRIGLPLVDAAPRSEDAPLAANYIAEIRAASIADLRAAGLAPHPAAGNPLLYHLLRQGALTAYDRIGLGLAIFHGEAVPAHGREYELVGICPGTHEWPTVWDRFDRALPTLTGSTALGTWLLEASGDPERAPVRDYRDALARLEVLPTAELERLLTETLDTCAHRVDAWITSLATRRLAARRAAQGTGVHLGGFGWVEDLRPRTTPRPGAAGGHIHAPSARHAAAAAILRNAHLTRTGSARAQVAVDLSSRRVRGALELLDGVRQGQLAGAVLGYRFERALHDAALDVYIAPFRARFPIGRDPAAPPEVEGERLAARDVVNGLTLRDAIGGTVDPATLPWGALPPVAVGHRAAVAACLARLEDQVDAAADLALAEAVFQAAHGNSDRVAATLAGLSGGGALPAPQLASAPRAGTSFVQRVAIVFGAHASTAPWPNHTRSKISPRLAAWVGALLGDPARARARIGYPDPQPGDPAHRGEAWVTMGDLDLDALDVLALARATGDGAGPDELTARLVRHALAQGLPGPFELELGRPPAAERDELGMAELIELARTLDALVAAARPLTAADLAPTGRDVDPALDTSGPDDRIGPNLAAVADLAAALDAAIAGAGAALAPLRAALWDAVTYVRAAVPVDLAGTGDAARAALVAQATRVRAELDRRLTAAAPGPPAAARLAALFDGTLPILVPFTPPDRAALDLAFAQGTALVDDAWRPRRWFTGAARVRPRLAPLRTLALTTEAITGADLDLSLVQLPYADGARWIGLPFDAADPAQRPRAGTLSLAVRTALDTTSSIWSGLLVDEWVETIPGATQATAFAVHHDAPVAEAPQCVLLAVSPDVAPTWSLASLVDTIHDALDLAKVRAVDGDQLGLLGFLAPTLYLAANVAGDTIATELAGQVVADTLALPPE